MRKVTTNIETDLSEYIKSRDQIEESVRDVKSNGRTVIGLEPSQKNERMIQFDRQLFNEWLHQSLKPLEGDRPIDLMVNFYGLDFIKQFLGRIDNTSYS